MKLLFTPGADGIGTLVLSNPPRNTFDQPLFAERSVVERVLDHPGQKALILQGEGRHFSHGAAPEKLREQLRAPDFQRELDRGKELLALIADAPVPVLALIRGGCLGAGLEIALCCHFRFAAASALFGFPEVGLGLIPGFGGPLFLDGVATRRTAVDLLLSGRMIGAPEAHDLGLVDRVCPAAALDQSARDYLRGLVGKRSVSQVRAVMESLRNARRLPLAKALRRETELFMGVAREQ
ncbi:MAG: enoyl-CoA hydratase/isomerase family protein [Candidatus Methylomirabilia bacterium]